MILENRKIVRLKTKKSREYYKGKGYNVPDDTELLVIKTEDLVKSSHSRVFMTCDDCGTVSRVIGRDYMRSNKKEHYCIHCKGRHFRSEYQESRSKDWFARATKFANIKGYEITTTMHELKDAHSLIEFVCPLHGPHRTQVYCFCGGHGCPDCQYENMPVRSADELRAFLLGNGIIILNPDEYSGYNNSNLKIQCQECGKAFVTSLNSLNRLVRLDSPVLCATCSKSESRGERKVREFLTTNNITFEQEKRFEDCKDKCTLPFDFYLPKQKMVIEYIGKQHYEPVHYFGGEEELQKRKAHDGFKKRYCEAKGIGYLAIPYTEYSNIESLLTDKLLT